MKKHQYPQHIVDAVQNAILNKTNICHGPVAQQLAEVALEALWEASRIESMHTVEVLDRDAILLDVDGCPWTQEFPGEWWCAGHDRHESPQFTEDELPAHILHWGSQD